MGKIFICYRRQDSQETAGRLYDRLESQFGDTNVFKDVDSLRPGEKFAERIKGTIAQCDVLLALVGERWLDARDAAGRRRLDDPDDYVRLEIEEALRQGVKVVPVLLCEASMPPTAELPGTCSELSALHASRLRPDPDFRHDVSKLLTAVATLIVEREADRVRSARERRLRRAPLGWVVAGISVVALIAMVANRGSVAPPLAVTSGDNKRSPVVEQPATLATAKPTHPSTPAQAEPIATLSPVPPAPASAPPLPARTTQIEAPKLITSSLGMQLTLIPAGEFVMGSSERAADLKAAGFGNPADVGGEQPAHRVRISRPFYLATHEVTKGQFAAFVAASEHLTDAERIGIGGGYDAETNSFARRFSFDWRSAGFPQTDNDPVVNVSWDDAVAFCRWLSRTEGGEYRLPTEAEWEYACRGGTTTRFFTGDEPQSVAGYANVRDAAFERKFPNENYVESPRFPFDDSFPFTAPVGSFKPNAFGLYDMHGNVLEWCQDWYDRSYYAHSPLNDPPGPDSGDIYRVCRALRGGSFNDQSPFARSAYRGPDRPAIPSYNVGFRPARTYP